MPSQECASRWSSTHCRRKLAACVGTSLGSISVVNVAQSSPKVAPGRVAQTGTTLQVGRPLAPNQQVAISSGLRALTAEKIQSLRVRVDGAQVVGD